ncbi:MAG: hypothetical protein ABL934_09940 [Lysobacteraceae bacterium]
MSKSKAGLFGTLSFVSGILGFGALPIIGTIGAIYFGHKARALNSLHGDSSTVTFFAGGGFWMGWIQAVLGALTLLATLAFVAIYGLSALQCTVTDCEASNVDVITVTPTHDGHAISSIETNISGGQKAKFYFTDEGFIPMSTERVQILSAGPATETDEDAQNGLYRWRFNLKFAKGVNPTSMMVENVTEREAAEVILPKQDVSLGFWPTTKDGKTRISQNPELTVFSKIPCRMSPDETCSAWLYTKEKWSRGGPDSVFVGLRFNIAYADGAKETIYQGLSFGQKDTFETFSLDKADD